MEQGKQYTKDWKTKAVKAFHEKVGATCGQSIEKTALNAIRLIRPGVQAEDINSVQINAEVSHEAVLEKAFTDTLMSVASVFMTFSDKLKDMNAKHSDLRVFRSFLIVEEVAELLIELAQRKEENVAKEISDLLYVTYGTAVAFDIPIDDVFEEVHNSNMTKSANAADKVGDRGKGPNYRKADVKSILEKYRSEQNDA